MIHVTYRLTLPAPGDAPGKVTLIRFSTGMEIAVPLDSLERLSDCLDQAANGRRREIENIQGSKLMADKVGQSVHLRHISLSGNRAVDLSRPMAQQLAADLKHAYRCLHLNGSPHHMPG
jgi:hypothetical protein